MFDEMQRQSVSLRLVMVDSWNVAIALEVGWERCFAGYAK